MSTTGGVKPPVEPSPVGPAGRGKGSVVPAWRQSKERAAALSEDVVNVEDLPECDPFDDFTEFIEPELKQSAVAWGHQGHL